VSRPADAGQTCEALAEALRGENPEATPIWKPAPQRIFSGNARSTTMVSPPTDTHNVAKYLAQSGVAAR